MASRRWERPTGIACGTIGCCANCCAGIGITGCGSIGCGSTGCGMACGDGFTCKLARGRTGCAGKKGPSSGTEAGMPTGIVPAIGA